MADKNRKNNKNNGNHQKGKQPLRAHDIVPLTEPEHTRNQEQTGPKTANPQISQIPRFDLANNIMAGKRQKTARRRKRPAKTENVEHLIQSPQKLHAINHTTDESPPAHQIIADIVKRDIRKLCQSR